MNNNDSSKQTRVKTAFNIAVRYLARQPRTVFQVKTHLKKKHIEPDISHEVIRILQEKKYLDDEEFAALYLENKSKFKPKSKYAYRYELKKKGICASVIETVLLNYDDDQLALRAVRSKIRQWQNIDAEQLKKKVMNFLRYRGFDYHTSISALHFIRETQGGNDED